MIVIVDKVYVMIVMVDMIEFGMYLNVVGGDCFGKIEFEVGVLYVGCVFVEFELQLCIEGEIQQMLVDFFVIELWCVLQCEMIGCECVDEVMVFDLVGFVFEDYLVLCYLYVFVQQYNVGVEIVLILLVVDLKNLFVLIDDLVVIVYGYVVFVIEVVVVFVC